MTKENAELKGERTFTLELTEAELEELDSATYDMASYERHEAMIYARDMDKNIHSLRAKVIVLVNKARFESAPLLEEQAYIAGARENGIEWHDLRKHPEDLPKDRQGVWTNKGGAYHDSDGWFDDCGRVNGVFAWCKPQFKE